MDYVYYIYNNVKYFYNSMNSATLSGAIDVIVVEQPDGSLASTPFHVRFGKYGVFNYENKYVDIEINGEEIDLKMKLGENGVALFANDEEGILDLLNLNYGSNDARFTITTKYQGTAWCSCHIYLLKWYDKLVISDIDGTITKSDVLGHVIPAIGGTWAHSGSHYTKTYLQNFAQGSRTLPDGPVLLSPSSVLMAFRKEVIERKPEEFKIACLTDLKSLFPVGQPFFAGFGNRETDVKSYLAVQIPPERIMIIDPQGSLRRADNKAGGYVSDYPTLAMDSVDYVFPPRVDMDGIDIRTKEDGILSEFIAWRTDAEQFDALVDAELEEYEERSKRAKAIVAGTTDGRGADGKKKIEQTTNVLILKTPFSKWLLPPFVSSPSPRRLLRLVKGRSNKGPLQTIFMSFVFCLNNQTLYINGQIGIAAGSTDVVPSGARAEAKRDDQHWENSEYAGSSFKHVINCNIMVADDMSDFPEVNETVKDFFTEDTYPARSFFQMVVAEERGHDRLEDYARAHSSRRCGAEAAGPGLLRGMSPRTSRVPTTPPTIVL
ncbi:hypothetical protein niasHT_035630 [Heterodera trifolii]|uniref:LNS2/PITP domain-containing protein n=1 Tax=Heterodera trifolii TaxID=157864 RepID=A0ABD2HTS1_9BILA